MSDSRPSLEIEHKFAIFSAFALFIFGFIGGVLSGYWPFALLLMAFSPLIVAFAFWVSPLPSRKRPKHFG